MSALVERVASLIQIDREAHVRDQERQLRQANARHAMAMAGGHTGASLSRHALRGWKTPKGDADADTLPDLPELRARSRDLVRNAPLGAAAINTSITHVVGTGLAYQCAIDGATLGLSEEQAKTWKRQVQAEWKLWAEGTDHYCDATRHQNFYGLQELAFRSVLESGDCVVLTPALPRPGAIYRLAVQIIEADRLSTPDGLRGNTAIADGLESDAAGAPVAYHLCRTHPGAWDRKARRIWDRYLAFGPATGRRNVLHLFHRRRPGQSRGVPMLAPVVEQLKQLSRYTEAELQAAVVSAAFALFVKMDAEAFGSLFNEEAQADIVKAASKWDGTIGADGGPCKAVNILPGESIESVNPGRPNDKFDPFVKAIFWQVGAAIEIPAEVLIKKFDASYSAARAALLDAWRFFRARRQWLADSFCQPIFELWLDEAVATGRLKAPGYFTDPRIAAAYRAAKWVGDGPGSIDPSKEVGAAQERVDMGMTTLEEECMAYDGGDWETKHAQRIRENDARRGAGLLPSAPAASTAQPAPDDPEDPNRQ
jgi:lambda family phage portal protein